MKLISMVEFCLQYKDQSLESEEDLTNKYGYMICYAEFLKQTLKLGMFVPCDLDGGVLSEPKQFSNWDEKCPKHTSNNSQGNARLKWWEDCEQYQQAKDRVVFEGFYGDNVSVKGFEHFLMGTYSTINELSNNRNDLAITPKVVDKFKLNNQEH